MAKLSEILNQPEGRRLEFKASLPGNTELAKTIIAFTNDAGGELYLGIQDSPRKVVGIDEELLIELEEKISSIIHDQCTPTILPQILFQNHNGRYVIVIKIHKGSSPPYFQKSKGIAFRVTFINKNFQQPDELQQDFKEELSALGTKLGLCWDQVGTKSAPSRHQVGTKSAPSWNQIMSILEFCIKPKTIQEIMQKEEWKDRTKFRNKYIKPFLDLKLLSMTIPDKPNSSRQQYQITKRGEAFLQFLNQVFQKI